MKKYKGCKTDVLTLLHIIHTIICNNIFYLLFFNEIFYLQAALTINDTSSGNVVLGSQFNTFFAFE